MAAVGQGLQKLYADLEELLQTGWDRPRVVANKIQKKLLEIEKYKKRQLGTVSAGLAGYISGLYPDIRDPRFNQELAEHPLVRQYTKNITSRELAERVYRTYMGLGAEQKREKKPVGKKEEKKLLFTDPEQVLAADKVSVFIHSNIQKMLRNFMSPRTPYRGLLVIHGTGVGKTCTSITIAEALKDFELEHGTKIYVIRPDEFKRQIFDRNAWVKGQPQCTGDTYPDAIGEIPSGREALLGCQKGRAEDCTKVDREVRKVIRRYYEFSTNFLWAKKVAELIRNKTRGLEGLEKHQKMVAVIRKTFNSSVLIIDEAHTFRNMGGVASSDSGTGDVAQGDALGDATASVQEIEDVLDEVQRQQSSQKKSNARDDKKDGLVGDEEDISDRLISIMINKVLTYSQNMRVILLTATPMYDRPQDIIPLLNYLLLNDKRPSVSERDIFEPDGSIRDKDRLVDVSRGYVSYVRGNDPNNFPIRLSADYNLAPRMMFNPTDYPRRDILGRPIEKTVKHFKLVACPLSKEQQNVLLGLVGVVTSKKKPVVATLTTPTADTDAAETNTPTADTDAIETNTSRTSVDDMADLDGSISHDAGDIDLADQEINDPNFSVAFNAELQSSNVIFKTLDETGGSAGACYGRIGFANCFQKIPGRQAYRFRDEEHARRFMSSGLLEYAPKLYQCLANIEKCQGPAFVYSYYIAGGILPMAFALELAGYTRYGGEPPLLESKYKQAGESRGEYILYIGSKQLSRGANKYLDLRQSMVNETSVKVVLASRTGSVGLNLFGFREIHILDPWHNVNLLEQTIGRVIRTESHAHLPPEKRNVCVYQYATVMSGAYKDRESVDLRVYAICEGKALKSGRVELVLKENALDCSMNKPLNYRAKSDYPTAINITTSHGVMVKYNLWDEPYSRDSLYMPTSNFKCLSDIVYVSGNHKIDLDKQKIVARVLGKELGMYQMEINEIISIVLSKIKKYSNLMSSDIWKIIRDALHLDKQANEIEMGKNIYAYLSDYFKNINSNILDNNGRECKLVVLNDFSQGMGNGSEFMLRLVPLTEFNPAIPLANQYNSGIYKPNQPDKYYFSKHNSKVNTKRHVFDAEPVGAHPVKNIHINPLVQILRKDKLKLIDKTELDYAEIVGKLESRISSILSRSRLVGNKPVVDELNIDYSYDTNIKITDKYGFTELYKIMFDRLLYIEKLYLLQNLITKIKFMESLSTFEKIIIKLCRFNLVSNNEVFKSGIISADEYNNIDFVAEPGDLYGFLIARFNKLTLYRFETNMSDGQSGRGKYDELRVKDLFVEEKVKFGTLIDRRWRGSCLQEGKVVNSLFGYLVYTKSDTLPPVFKITDYLTKGYKKSVKGVSCVSPPVDVIVQYIRIIEPQFEARGFKYSKNKRLVCGDFELFCRIKSAQPDAPKFFLSPEEYAIWQTYKE